MESDGVMAREGVAWQLEAGFHGLAVDSNGDAILLERSA